MKRPPLAAATVAAVLALTIAACSGGAHHTGAKSTDNGAPAVPVLTAGATGSAATATASGTASHQGGPAPLTTAVPLQQSTGWNYGPVTTLPVDEPAGGATQVITVSAASTRSETATLRAWQRSGAGWAPYGPPVVAYVGRSGITATESEALTASPIGSFSLTQAFGRLPNPGTRLPYFQTSPSDWWISQPGQYYNTHQVCLAACAFNTGTPNARLYYVAPQYDLAIVIDYNRFPVVQGAGSGIFLHVTAGRPTNGCVSIALPDLVRIMRWVNPADHPRILIGVTRSA